MIRFRTSVLPLEIQKLDGFSASMDSSVTSDKDDDFLITSDRIGMVFGMAGRDRSLAQDGNKGLWLGRSALTWSIQWDLHGQGVLRVCFAFSTSLLSTYWPLLVWSRSRSA